MDNFLSNTLSIVIQPKQNFHFRYVSELRNTHGVLTGQLQQTYRPAPQNSVIEDTYPTVRLQLPCDGHLDECGNKRDFFILCSLHGYDDTGPQSLSPHLLMGKGNRTPTYDFIFAPMQENSKDPLERSWQLKDCVIVRLKPEDYLLSLDEKRRHYESLHLSLDFERLKGDLDVDDPRSVKTSGILNVCLGFTIFERNFYTNEYLYKETIYSDNIFHGDDLRIHELCNTKGPIAGGTKVHILIKLQSGYKYYVRMFKYNSDMTYVDWEEFIPITNDEIFSNAAITYTLPPGPTNVSTDEIEVMIEIIVNQTTYKSKAVKFWYLNTDDNESGRRKRPRPRPEESSAATADLVTNVVTLPNLIDSIDPNLMHFSSSPGTELNIPDAIATYDMNISYLPQAEQLPTTSSFNDLLPESFSFLNVDNLVIRADANLSLGEIQDEDEFVQRLIAETLELSSNDSHSESREPVPYCSRDRCESVGSRKDIITKDTPNKPMDISALIKKRIEQILNVKATSDIKDINIRGLSNKSGNTIFHDALVDMDTLIYLYRQQKKSPMLRELILKARNTYRQNLLHYACVLDKASCIRPLVGMGIALNEQDSLGRTPLHIAIEHNYTDSLHKLQNLLEDHSKYPTEVEMQLIKMFQVYSHRGHTVLHAAAIENLYDLVEVMLEFCKTHQLDILQYEVLGSGDSIVHLIVKRNLVGMIALIRQYVPQYLVVQNYPGQTVLQITELSTEMLQALTAVDGAPDLSTEKMFQDLSIK